MEHPKELSLDLDGDITSLEQTGSPSLHASEGFNIAIALSLGLLWIPAFFLLFVAGWKSLILYGVSLAVVVLGTVFLRRPFRRHAYQTTSGK